MGEGYYADRTARQTVEILKRRGKSLELQVESLKAKMMNLEAEAKFFDSTATDAAVSFVVFISLVAFYDNARSLSVLHALEINNLLLREIYLSLF